MSGKISGPNRQEEDHDIKISELISGEKLCFLLVQLFLAMAWADQPIRFAQGHTAAQIVVQIDPNAIRNISRLLTLLVTDNLICFNVYTLIYITADFALLLKEMMR